MKNLSLGKKLKAIRQSKSYTQEGVAYETDISLSKYRRIERDEADVTILDLENIAKVLEVSVIDIINFKGNYISEIEKLKKLIEEKDEKIRAIEEMYTKELRIKDQEIISLQKQLLKTESKLKRTKK